jgi:hypothetical protein
MFRYSLSRLSLISWFASREWLIWNFIQILPVSNGSLVVTGERLYLNYEKATKKYVLIVVIGFL